MALALLVAGGVALADHLATTVDCSIFEIHCIGPDGSAHIYGKNDPLQGDSILAGSGDDQVDALAGSDYVEGDHSFPFNTGDGGNDTVYGGEGIDQLIGNAGNDRLFGAAGRDTLWGNEGDDFYHGGPGNDVIEDDFGADSSNPGAGKDEARAGDGSDIISTGRYRDGLYSNGDGYVDTVDCGSGTDTVHFEKGVDTISANCEIRKPYR
jgi:Ca2+-binding RTX toxin-like protein